MRQICYLRIFLALKLVSSVATDGKNGHGYKLENVVPSCPSFNAMPVTITKKIVVSAP